ncbi:MAG: CDP-alcohol phosphatidyltransferase, partial [Flavobacteriaceae bacterium]|nr:CDP-alcohol phosphatidyltransferase [Flavobacteriaceae bacterium]
SRVIENTKPNAFKGESQSRVNLFYNIYNVLYICFDKCMYYMDKNARYCHPFPKWFMTLISLYGLGFQLLLMALMLVFELQRFVIPFFIGYSVLIIVFICIRKLILKP